MPNENFDKIQDVQNTSEQDQTRTRQISEIKDIDKLINFINALGKIPGTSDGYVFTGVELANIIKAVKEKDTDVNGNFVTLEAVTRTWGIRDKVYELLGENVVSSELEERRQQQSEQEEIVEEEQIIETPIVEAAPEIVEEAPIVAEQKQVIEDIEITPQPIENIEVSSDSISVEQVELEKPEEVAENVAETQEDVVKQTEQVPVQKPEQVAVAEKPQEKDLLESALERCDTLHLVCLQKESQLAEEKRKNKGFVKGLWNKVIGNNKIAELTKEVEDTFAEYSEAEQEYLALQEQSK